MTDALAAEAWPSLGGERVKDDPAFVLDDDINELRPVLDSLGGNDREFSRDGSGLGARRCSSTKSDGVDLLYASDDHGLVGGPALIVQLQPRSDEYNLRVIAEQLSLEMILRPASRQIVWHDFSFRWSRFHRSSFSEADHTGVES